MINAFDNINVPHIRPLSELAAVSKMREASIAKTQVYTEVHADLRAKLSLQMSKPHLCSLAQPATSEFASAVEFGERSIDSPVRRRLRFASAMPDTASPKFSSVVAAPRVAEGEAWWTMQDSNLRPID